MQTLVLRGAALPDGSLQIILQALTARKSSKGQVGPQTLANSGDRHTEPKFPCPGRSTVATKTDSAAANWMVRRLSPSVAERSNFQVPEAVKRRLSECIHRRSPRPPGSLVKSKAEPPTSAFFSASSLQAIRLRAALPLPSEFQPPTCIATHQNASFKRPKAIHRGPPTAIIGGLRTSVIRTTTTMNTVTSLRTALSSNSAMISPAINTPRRRVLIATLIRLASPTTQSLPVTASHWGLPT